MNRRAFITTLLYAAALAGVKPLRAVAKAEPTRELAPGAMRLRRGIDGATRDFASMADPAIAEWAQGGDAFMVAIRPHAFNGIDFGGQHTFVEQTAAKQPRLMVPGLRQEPLYPRFAAQSGKPITSFARGVDVGRGSMYEEMLEEVVAYDQTGRGNHICFVGNGTAATGELIAAYNADLAKLAADLESDAQAPAEWVIWGQRADLERK